MTNSTVSSTTPLIGVKKDDFKNDWTIQKLSADDIKSLGLGDVNKDGKVDLEDLLASADSNKDDTIDANELQVFYGKLDWSHMTEPARAASFAVEQWTNKQYQDSFTTAQTDAKNTQDQSKIDALKKAQDAQQKMTDSLDQLNQKYTDAAQKGMNQYQQQMAAAQQGANIASKIGGGGGGGGLGG